MSRAAVAPILWFAMVWFGWEVLVSVVDLPRAIGPILGLLAAASIAVVLWRTTTRGSMPTLVLTPKPSD